MISEITQAGISAKKRYGRKGGASVLWCAFEVSYMKTIIWLSMIQATEFYAKNTSECKTAYLLKDSADSLLQNLTAMHMKL